ncbi:hypothetical protein MSAN_02420000 [Mycena sanguinolenta]|uniref:Uncharacterized protein n=1 Tax=Mycena sanguinolenta TaxID=230812 RepID=A0A8H7CEJ5_9AGAR|nr:hypothetical protein MSAN_02420000 [Mycena sanguinolenta]
MPKLKRKSCTTNLGSFAKKKAKITEDPSLTPDSSRPTSPEDSEQSVDEFPVDLAISDHESVVSSEDSDLSEAVGDVPVFESENGLLAWLEVGKERLKKILESIKQPKAKEKGRGPYYKTKIGATPAPRTDRLQRATQKKNVKAHGLGLVNWLNKARDSQPASTSTSEARETVQADGLDDQPIDVDALIPTPSQAEDLGENGHEATWRSDSPSPSELSRLEEDGLGDCEELFTSINADRSHHEDRPTSHSFDSSIEPTPSIPSSGPEPLPQDPERVQPKIRFGAPSFSRADESFHPTVTAAPGMPPPPKQIDEAIKKLQNILRPSRGPNTRGYHHAELNMVLHGRLELMLSFLRLYAAEGYTEWGEKGRYNRKDEENLPTSEYGKFNSSVLEDEDLAQEIHLHLQELGPFISAQDVVNYMSSDEMKTRLNLKHGISLRTAQRWMKRTEYRWKAEPKGMYIDGHEREDVVNYRQNEFLPQWAAFDEGTRKWVKKGGDVAEDGTAQAAPKKKTKRQVEEEQWEEWEEEPPRSFIGMPDGKIVVIWRHDECIFYANDRRKIRWVHASETAKPRKKGEGKSMMVIAFVSPDYGWEARLTIKPGKTRDGYYGNEEILKHATTMMDTLDEKRPNEIHVLAYDNATIHTARAPDALSARYMVVKTPGIDKKTGVQKNFLVKKKSPDGRETEVRMRDGMFADGSPQSLYFPEGHPKAGIFKGMHILIHERIAKGANLPNPDNLKAECKKFKCPPGRTDCCCRRILYTQPDFVNQKSLLEEHCAARGYQVIFFPKFHCELNFIEQCWGFAKRIYRMFPASSKEEDLERNMNAALDAVPIETMRKFMDAYRKGLNGTQAAWAGKRYRGHRVLPKNIMALFDRFFHKKNQ